MSTVTGTEPSPATRRSPVRWIAIAVLAVLVLLVGILATRPAADTKTPASPLVGQPAPKVAGTSLDGRAVDLSSMKGRYVVLNFFATWCGPCRQEHPEIVKFSQQHTAPHDPTVVAVAYDQSDINAAKSFFAQNGGTWPVLPDNAGHISIDYGVRGLPETYVIDPDGNIAAHVTGGVTLDKLDQLTGTRP
jgi:cytochrome c biogenesis protein CcmG/thiol:disulfide interchange protein DsbE